MSRIASLGSALQDIYLIDYDDLKSSKLNDSSVFGRIFVGTKIDIDKVFYGTDGGGISSAITFARHGHEAIFIGNVGRDSAGAAIIEVLDRENVDSSYVNILKRRSTGTSVILLNSKTGERTILTHGGASEQFGNFDEHDIELCQPDWLYVSSLSGDFDTLKRFFEKCKEIGTKIMFNPGEKELRDRKQLTSLLKYVNILSVNKDEATKLVPGLTLSEQLYRLSNYVDLAIITDGPMGGIAGSKEQAFRFGIYEDIAIKDVTGAGSAFNSGFLAHYAEEKTLKESLIFASANATSVVSKIGANNGILNGNERLHLMPIQKL